MNNAPMGNENELDRVLAAYREACEAPEASVEFMPRLWDRIDAGQKWTQQVWKWANSLVAAAAMASLFFAMLQMLPKTSAAFYSATYLETLADEHDKIEALGDFAMASRSGNNGPQEQAVK